jgi:cell division GTPase FtsZ
MGAGTGSNVYDAMDSAVSSPLLGDGTTSRARRVILNLTASNDTTLDELDTAFDHLRARLSEDASVIWNVDVGPGRAAAVLYATDFERRADSGL